MKSIVERIDKMKQIHAALLEFLENDDSDVDNFISILDFQNFQNFKHELQQIVDIVLKIANNYHRTNGFIEKIEQIIKKFQNDLKKNFTNYELFDLFKSNKRILHFLFKEEIIIPDKKIYYTISNQSFFLKKNYLQYFSIEFQKFKVDIRIDDNYEKMRLIGENDSYICTLIRNDSVEEFISYVNKTNFSLSSKIEKSIYETNSFLLKNEVTLIEYAAFYGSIQIFQYLRFNNVQINSSIWLYAIHSKNPEMIHYLEELNVSPPLDSYLYCLIESIKCHHNDIANYIINNLLNQNFEKLSFDTKFNENIYKYIFKYHNYEFFQENLNHQYSLFYLFIYNYFTLFVLYIQDKQIDFEKIINSALNYKIDLKIKDKNAEMLNFLLKSDTEIKTKMFKSFLYIKNLTIPSSIKSINCKGFFRCLTLTHVSIPNSVKAIKEYAFSRCSSLVQICIPNSITEISPCCFEFCSSLKEIVIPSSVKSIRCMAFQYCLSLQNIVIPNSVNEIGNCAFYKCLSLSQITIPTSVTSIGNDVFFECSSLTQITIPSSITAIRNNVFYRCTSLSQITIPSSVISIGKNAFDECFSLTQITIPSSVTSIGNSAFFGCSSLTQITIPSSVTSIGNSAFSECSSLTQITIPSSVKSIGDYTFSGCYSLTQITIPSSVTSIGKNAFYGCSSLKQITIPSSVTSIGEDAFYGCSSLAQISSPSSFKTRKIGLNSNVKIIKIKKK